jgi:hypothetical protein
MGTQKDYLWSSMSKLSLIDHKISTYDEDTKAPLSITFSPFFHRILILFFFLCTLKGTKVPILNKSDSRSI